MGPSVITRQDHLPRTSQTHSLRQQARKSGRLGGGPHTLKPENSLPLPHPRPIGICWAAEGKRAREAAKQQHLTVIRRQHSVTSPGGARPTLVFSLPSERGLLPGCPKGLCAAELTFLWEAVQQSDKPLTPAANSLPRPQGLTRLKACLLLPSRSLKQPACVLGRAGRDGAPEETR